MSPGEVFQHSHNDASITMLQEGVVELEVAGSRTPLVQGMPTPVDANMPHRLINVGPGLAIVKCVHVKADPPPFAG